MWPEALVNFYGKKLAQNGEKPFLVVFFIMWRANSREVTNNYVFSSLHDELYLSHAKDEVFIKVYRLRFRTLLRRSNHSILTREVFDILLLRESWA